MFAQETKTVRLYSFDSHGIYCGAFDYKWEVGTGIAANSTLEIPPEAQEGFVCVWNNQSWELKEDYRDKVVYSTLDRSESKVDYIGSIKEGYTLLKPNTEFDSWNGAAWVDKRTEEEKHTTYLSQFISLTRRQFKLVLLENGLLETIEQMIESIEDPTVKARIKIEYIESERFERTNDSVKYMLGLLELTTDQVDEMWRYAITL